jgi:aquaporin Z
MSTSKTPLALLAEFIGAFILITTILISGDPLAIGLSLAVVVYMLGPLSGGHVNPAVSIAKTMQGAINYTTLMLYILMQILGGLAAYGLYKAFSTAIAADPKK